MRTVLRSGCYVTHDHGSYEVTSPLRSGGDGPARCGRPWSCGPKCSPPPSPANAIVGFGKRDVSYDQELPIPLTWIDAAGTRTDVTGRAKVGKLNDQHAFLRSDLPLRPGDVLTFGIAHPCTAFDKWRLLPVIDTNTTVVDAIRTFF